MRSQLPLGDPRAPWNVWFVPPDPRAALGIPVKAQEQLSWEIPEFGQGEQGNEHKSRCLVTPGKAQRQRGLLPPGVPKIWSRDRTLNPRWIQHISNKRALKPAHNKGNFVVNPRKRSYFLFFHLFFPFYWYFPSFPHVKQLEREKPPEILVANSSSKPKPPQFQNKSWFALGCVS